MAEKYGGVPIHLNLSKLKIKISRYIFRGSNCAILFFAALLIGSLLVKEKKTLALRGIVHGMDE